MSNQLPSLRPHMHVCNKRVHSFVPVSHTYQRMRPGLLASRRVTYVRHGRSLLAPAVAGGGSNKPPPPSVVATDGASDPNQPSQDDDAKGLGNWFVKAVDNIGKGINSLWTWLKENDKPAAVVWSIFIGGGVTVIGKAVNWRFEAWEQKLEKQNVKFDLRLEHMSKQLERINKDIENVRQDMEKIRQGMVEMSEKADAKFEKLMSKQTEMNEKSDAKFERLVSKQVEQIIMLERVKSQQHATIICVGAGVIVFALFQRR